MDRTMKAMLYDRYGPPDVVRVGDVPVPEPVGAQVLVKMSATSINLTDWEGLTGSPAYARIGGIRRPAKKTLGSDISGVVEAVGPEVQEFTVGDAVYGDNLAGMGGFAEYAVASERVLAPKPPELTHVEASTIPQAGAIALQGMVRAADGKRVLINGAGGGSGAFAIQLAKRAGAYVTAVDNGGKLDFMNSLGADEVVDYTKNDFVTSTEPHDLILDLVATRSPLACKRALAPGGVYRCVGGPARVLLGMAIGGLILGRLSDRSIGVLGVKMGPTHFAGMAELCSGKEIAIHVDRVFDLADVAEALAYVGAGKARGKVVVTSG